MTPLDLARAFLAKGREDELLLSRNLGERVVSDTLLGFHAQQAAEKYLKAVLAIDQDRPKRTHDLDVLAEQCVLAGHSIPEDASSWLAPLSTYAVRPRYPFAEVDAVDRQTMLTTVRALRSWAESVVDAAS